MNINNYCDKIISICIQMTCNVDDENFISKIKQDNKRYDNLHKINSELIKDKTIFKQVYKILLKYKDDRVRMWSVASCLENDINTKEAKRVARKLRWFSKSSLIRLSAESILIEFKKEK